jgi:hypothetical protein
MFQGLHINHIDQKVPFEVFLELNLHRQYTTKQNQESDYMQLHTFQIKLYL